MEHKVSSVNVLHDKEEVIASLEAGVETCQEWRLLLKCQNLPLIEGAFNVIFLDNEIFLQTLNSIYFL